MKSRLSFVSMILIFALLIVTFGLCGCTTWLTKKIQNRPTYGQIMVDYPEVFTRERLLARRHAEREWLENKLNFTSHETRFEGFRDIRVLDQMLSNSKVKYQPLQGELTTASLESQIGNSQRQNELAGLQHQIDILNIQKQLEQLQEQPGPLEPGKPSESSVATKKDLEAQRLALEAKIKAIETKVETTGLFLTTDLSGKAKLPDPKTMVKTDAQVSYIDQLRDDLTYRDAIHAELREKELDDTHDLRGMTIYTLKFDVTVLPGENSQRLGKVSLNFKSCNNRIENQINPTVFKNWKKQLEKDLSLEALSLQQRLLKDTISDEERVGLLNEVQNALLAPESPRSLFLGYNRTEDYRNDISNLVDALEKKRVPTEDDLKRACVLVIAPYLNALGSIVHFLPPVELEIKNQKFFVVKLVDNTPTYENAIKEIEKLTNRYDAEPYVYSIEPKERVQNISDVAAVEKMKNFIMSLSVALPQYGVDADSYNEHLRRTQELLHGIKRNPLAVSFLNNRTEFGWILGPKFDINIKNETPMGGVFGLFFDELFGGLFDQEESRLEFRHTPIQHSFQVNIVVPAWWKSINISGTYGWLDKKGRDKGQNCSRNSVKYGKLFLGSNNNLGSSCTDPCCKEKKDGIDVLLPSDLSALTTALLNTVRRRKPLINPRWDDDKDRQKIFVRAGSEAEIMIRGRDLWRNPEVYIGSQKAKGADILPDMKGLVAHFDKIKMPPRKNQTGDVFEDLVVFTSNGEVRERDAVQILREATHISDERIRFISTKVLNQTQLLLSVPTRSFSKGFHTMELEIRPKGTNDWKKVLLSKKDTEGIKDVALGRTEVPITIEYDNTSWTTGDWGTVLPFFAEMEARYLKIKLREGSSLEKVSSDTVEGTFIYFKDERSSKLSLLVGPVTAPQTDIKYKPYTPSGGTVVTAVTLDGKITFKLENKNIFIKAYPGLEDTLQGTLTLHITHDNKMESVAINRLEGKLWYAVENNTDGSAHIIIKTKDLETNINSNGALKLLFSSLSKATADVEFGFAIEYAQGKKLEVHEKVKIVKEIP